ncbi:MAG: gliding motility-associated C-terminal domain-containing protein [Bacteroidia bacterium]
MKKTTTKNHLLALFLLLGTFGIKAQNLVLNPSFENTNITACSSPEGFQTNLLNWDDTNSGADSCSSPDLFSNCNVIFGFQTPTYQPNNTLGFQHPHSGNKYAGIITYGPGIASNCTPIGNDQYREYIEGTISTPLTAGQQYCVSFYVSLADNVAWTTNNLGVYFTNSLYTHNACPNNSLINFTPQLNYTCTPISDTSNWVQLQWNYTATGGETNFIIGNFFNNAGTTVACNNSSAGFTNPYAYFYIDDVSITAGTCCATSIKPQAPLCVTAPSVTLTTLGGIGAVCTPTLTGVWSGAGITNSVTGVFDPSVAGVGPHVISYSLSCGYVATTTININSCSLTACKDGSGNLTASGGTAPYTWSTVTSYTNCSGCPGGICFPIICAGVPSTSLTPYATNTSTVSAPGSYPIVVSDNGGNTYTITSSAATPTCAVTSTCTPITIGTITNNSVTCFGDNTGSAVVGINPAGTYTVTWMPGSLNGVSQSGLAAGVYTVTADAGGGCTGTNTVTIAQATAITTTITTTNATCNLSNGSATVTANGGTPNYTYTWSPAGGNSTTANNLASGIYSLTVTDANMCTKTSTVTISATGSPTITISSVPYCSGDSTALTASGATTYTWSSSTNLSSHSNVNSTSVTATPTAITIYTVTGTTGACSSTATISVGPLTFTVNKVNLCKGDSATLTASNPSLTYSWTPATALNHTSGVTVKASPTVTTVYTITATYGATCSLTVTDSVIVLNKPIISVLSPTVCSATSATITAIGALTYTWIPASGLSTSVTSDTAYVFQPTAPGTYTVIGSGADGCKDTAVSQVTISNHLGIIASNPSPICFGTSFSLYGIGASTYTWTSNDPANLNFGHDTTWTVTESVANVGSYTVAIYGESHSGTFCQGYDTLRITINPTPTVTVSNPTLTVCAGNSATLTATSIPGVAAALVYDWTPTTGLSATTNSTGITIATPPNTTIYTVGGYNQYGCGDYKTYTVTVIPLPTFNVNSDFICKGNSTTLTVSPTTTDVATYSWSPSSTLNTNSGTTVIASPTNTTTPTVYTITATTNVANCASLPQTATVTVRPLPTITITPTSTTICSGNTTTLTASNSLQVYTWIPNASIVGSSNTNVISVNPTTATVYTVSGMDAFGCLSNSVTATITMDPIQAVIAANPPTGDLPLTVQFTNNSVNSTTYVWTYGNGSTTYTTTNINDPNTNTIYTTPGTYTVTMESSNASGCQSTAVATIIVYEGFTITIPNVFTPNGDNINDNFFVKTTGLASIEMTIFDRWGLKLWESSSATGAWDGKNASDGTYFYIIKATSTKAETKEYKGPILLIK